jgi:hypothetical protein
LLIIYISYILFKKDKRQLLFSILFFVVNIILLLQFIPVGSAIINYIRRDGIIVPLLFKRVFTGESFLEHPKLGIIEDLGKDTVFLWGRKKVRFGLENINYTPDPRFFNLTRELYHLGFDDTDDLYNVLNIPSLDPERDRAKKVFYMERMAQVYWNMTHEQPRGGKRLVMSFKRRGDKNVSFGSKRQKKERYKESEKEVEGEETESKAALDERLKRVLGEK